MNAQGELIEHIENREVDFVSVVYARSYSDHIKIKGTLAEVLPMLDFNYDNGYGRQKLFGYIWYSDGSWSEREEYDGSEWWQHQTVPDKDADIDV